MDEGCDSETSSGSNSKCHCFKRIPGPRPRDYMDTKPPSFSPLNTDFPTSGELAGACTCMAFSATKVNTGKDVNGVKMFTERA